VQLPEALAEGRESIQHYLQFYQVLVEIGELVISWDHLDRMWAALTGADDGLACAPCPHAMLKSGVAAFPAFTTHCILATVHSQHGICAAATLRLLSSFSSLSVFCAPTAMLYSHCMVTLRRMGFSHAPHEQPKSMQHPTIRTVMRLWVLANKQVLRDSLCPLSLPT